MIGSAKQDQQGSARLPLRQWLLLYGTGYVIAAGVFLLLGDWRYLPHVALLSAIMLVSEFYENYAPQPPTRARRVWARLRNLLLFVAAMLLVAMLL